MNITRSDQDGVAVFHLDGHLDSSTSRVLQETLLGAVEAGADRLALDLGGTEYVSSAGLRVVLMAAKQARSAGGGLAVFGLSNPVMETFEISGFGRIIPIVPTAEDAVRAVSSG